MRVAELHRLVQQVDEFSDSDQQALIVLLDGLVKRTQISKMALSVASERKGRRQQPHENAVQRSP